MGSIPTRSRHLAALTLLVAAATLPVGAGLLAGQEPPAPRPAATDTARGRPGPVTTFLMSLAVPGWSQARLDRKLTGAIFVTVEGLSLGMTVKTIRELHYLERVGADSARIDGKRRQRQDWLILLGFNHLFSGLEGFVASQLHDFPSDLRLRLVPVPGGRFAAIASVPLRLP